jgi:hypothetical protein
MNSEIKTRWIAALRSGEYVQGTGTLRYEDEFCCLGVLCDLYDPTRWENYQGATHHYANAVAVLPDEVQQWAGLSDENPSISPRKHGNYPMPPSSLAEANDAGYDFSQIADIIEKEL